MTRQLTLEQLVARCVEARASLPDSQRLLIAIAGAPGSGKSTLSAELAARLNKDSSSPLAAVVPMDGFHLDNAVLETQGLQARKGAPDTFDVRSFNDLLRCCRQPITDELVYFPLFDRHMDLARVAADSLGPNAGIVLVEGNYLLLQNGPWRELHNYFHVSVMLDVPLALLEKRLVQRWLDHGLDATAARQRALSNDIPNARTVLADSRAADYQVCSD